MKRRTLLVGGLVSATALFSLATLIHTDEDTIAMVVLKRLDYLKLDPEGLKRFARDIVRLRSASPARLKMLAAIEPVYRHYHLSNGTNSLANLLRHGEDRIVGSYLISSDFFVNGSDESRVVQYQGLLDTARACSNPFARKIV